MVSNIDLEDEKTVLIAVKKKMEQILVKVNPSDDSSMFWNNRGYEGNYDRRGNQYRRDSYLGQFERDERRQSSSSRRWEGAVNMNLDRKNRQKVEEVEDLERESRSQSRGRMNYKDNDRR